MAGLIGTSDISGSLDAKNIVSGVLTTALEMSNLVSLCTSVSVPELTATIPVMTAAAVDEDVEEFEVSEIGGSAFTHVDFDLKKDRVFVAASDEATYKSKAGDPLTIQINSAGVRLANIMDKKIVAAFETSPQTGGASAQWSDVSANPLLDLATAVAAIRPYKADFIVMPTAVYTDYMQLDFMETTASYAPSEAAGSVAKIPGVELDIYINDNVTAKSAIVGASNGTPAAVGNGPVKVREWDEATLGAKMYQMDVFRQAVAPVFTNSSSLNMSVYAITAILA
jgi:hypothetical protein